MLTPKDTGFTDIHGDPIKTGDWFIFKGGFYRVNGTTEKPVLSKSGKYEHDDIPLADAIANTRDPMFTMTPVKFNGVKRCAQCGETKPYDEFAINLSRRDLHFPYCRSCTKMRQMGYHTPIEEKRAQEARK